MAEHDKQDTEQNVYSEEVREEYVDSDEISAEEEGFMRGYDEADSDEKEQEEKKETEEEAEEE